MNLEKLGLLLFFKHRYQLEEVKTHLIGTCREFLLALTASFDILNKSSAETPLLKQWVGLETLLKKIDVTLKYSLKFLASKKETLDPEAFQLLKNQVFASVIDIIDDEMHKVTASVEPHSKMKKEALMAIKKALAGHLTTVSDTRDSPLDNPNLAANS